jgi:hypothetical protein
MEQKKELSPIVLLGYILGASLILSVCIGAFVFLKARASDNVFSVTGSARTQVLADRARWTSSFSRTVRESALKSGYQAMALDAQKVKAFFASKNIPEKDVVISPVMMDQVYDYRPETYTGEKEYVLRQTVTMASGDIHTVDSVARDVQALINQEVIYTSFNIEYYYSDLASLRVSLLADAIQDAKARASQMALSSGQKVGSLKSAASGVVQVMPAHSIDVSDYGAYDTSSIEKEVMVTVKASFSLR